jgi:hypothetical protein
MQNQLLKSIGVVLLLLVLSLVGNYHTSHLHLHPLQNDHDNKEKLFGTEGDAAEKTIDATAHEQEDTKKSSSEDTAIIITSSWIPSHPSTYMVEMVINSTKNQIAPFLLLPQSSSQLINSVLGTTYHQMSKRRDCSH